MHKLKSTTAKVFEPLDVTGKSFENFKVWINNKCTFFKLLCEKLKTIYWLKVFSKTCWEFWVQKCVGGKINLKI